MPCAVSASVGLFNTGSRFRDFFVWRRKWFRGVGEMCRHGPAGRHDYKKNPGSRVLRVPDLNSPDNSETVQRLDHLEHDGADERERSIRGYEIDFSGEIHGNCSLVSTYVWSPQASNPAQGYPDGTGTKDRAADHPRTNAAKANSFPRPLW
jgi:hypothetical protein